MRCLALNIPACLLILLMCRITGRANLMFHPDISTEPYQDMKQAGKCKENYGLNSQALTY